MPSEANEYCDIVIPTGMGLTRDFINALSADGVIIVGGGSGLYLKLVLLTCTRNQWLQLDIKTDQLNNSLMDILITEKM